MIFRVDTKAEHFVVTTPVALFTDQTATIIGATEDGIARSFYKACSCR